jgi:hypothetical protein
MSQAEFAIPAPPGDAENEIATKAGMAVAQVKLEASSCAEKGRHAGPTQYHEATNVPLRSNRLQ